MAEAVEPASGSCVGVEATFTSGKASRRRWGWMSTLQCGWVGISRVEGERALVAKRMVYAEAWLGMRVPFRGREKTGRGVY